MASDLRRALALLELDPRRIALAIAGGVAALGSALALAALAAWLIVRAWQMPPVLDLSVAVVSVRALGISRGVFRYLERLATHDAAFRGTTAARAQLYRRLADGDPAAVTGVRRGELLTRVGADVETLGEVVVRALVPMAVAILLGIAAVGLIATISLPAAAVLAAALVVAGILAPNLGARAARAAERASMTATGEYAGHAVTALDHAAELRVAGRLDGVLDAAEGAATTAARQSDRAAAGGAFAAAATPLAMGASVLGALLIGIVAYGPDGGSPGGMTPMALAILVLLPLSAFEAVGALPAAAVALSRARVAARRIMALLDRAAAGVPVAAGAPVPDGPLVARQLRCGWPDSRPTDPVDLTAEPGARIAIVGRSGVGKTTLLMTLAGLIPPVTGSVHLGGAAVAELDARKLRRDVTFFAEDGHLFDTSVLENLRVARGDLDTAGAVAALRSVGLGAWLDGLDDGVETVLRGGERAVSSGQRRRILLARALVSPARVLLLDEPTENLDVDAGARLLHQLLDRASGLVTPERTVIVVAHRLPEHTRADRVIELVRLGRENALPRS
ncbi:thiol reductant ABC exporter subunit CydC [Aldersonia sp. NBC_00410]|uniref:thiol reductant ABC exporter subunit CydC n=1 Tax=Aldersonia sp. NBC_00410 TaxID=2975954 RepID=UPI00224DB0E5|nr:thiol reductant ABC exporter subunit CydC [Aldersonia sp. NBC_00410]MCX5043442.1 thiol reductant ABC exporter subunit CydC [Aldersonia sp. NBC_00410]